MKHILIYILLLAGLNAKSQSDTVKVFTHQDTLRGSLGPGRTWWDVKYYDLQVDVDIENKQITGRNKMRFSILHPERSPIMQLDLQEPMTISAIVDVDNKPLRFTRAGNVYWVDFAGYNFEAGQTTTIDIAFSGKPLEAKRPPWDGGWVWKKDKLGRPWVTVACEGTGASCWYPCKDHLSDEPDDGASIAITVPDTLVAVANGRSLGTTSANGRKTWKWHVVNPINNYCIVPYIGKYVNWTEHFNGKKGDLQCDYWVLDYNLDKAKQRFDRDIPPMLRCFEDWFGPYPFYEDGFKMVEAPHLGMEHQSAIAYGNQYKDGYFGMDLSKSGWGLKWDFIIVHESGHEWWGNNITCKDAADMWIHESFTSYSEVLFTQSLWGMKAGDEYCQRIRKNITNEAPMISHYGVNDETDLDIYYKGENLLHMIRQIIGDDTRFKKILQGLNQQFYHQTVTTAQVEEYISHESGKDLSKVFDQYLRTKNIPTLEYKYVNGGLDYRWTGCIAGFNMPVKLANQNIWLTPTTAWQHKAIKKTGALAIDPNFYVLVKRSTKI